MRAPFSINRFASSPAGFGKCALGVLVGLLCAGGAACSGGGDDHESADVDAAVAVLVENVGTPADEWAKAAASAFASQLSQGAALNAKDLGNEFRTSAQELSKSLCSETEKSDALSSSGAADAVELQVSQAMSEVAARAFALDPALLVAMGMETLGDLPPFALLDPSADPATPVADGAALSGFIKADFLADSGGIKLPTSESGLYGDFQRWFYEPSLDNGLLEQASAATQPIRASLGDCLG